MHHDDDVDLIIGKSWYSIFEGLILSQSAGKLLLWLKKNGYDAKIKRNFEAPTERAAIHVFIDWPQNEEVAFRLLSHLRVCGWYIAAWKHSNGQSGKKADGEFIRLKIQDGESLGLILEPKFDEPAKPYAGHLYHVTRSVFMPKIKVQGLVVKAKEKLTSHPERIYLAAGGRAAYYIVCNLIRDFHYDDLVILEVDPSAAQDLRIDPNFWGGLYTIHAIRPEALKVVQLNQLDHSEDPPSHHYSSWLTTGNLRYSFSGPDTTYEDTLSLGLDDLVKG